MEATLGESVRHDNHRCAPTTMQCNMFTFHARAARAAIAASSSSIGNLLFNAFNDIFRIYRYENSALPGDHVSERYRALTAPPQSDPFALVFGVVYLALGVLGLALGVGEDRMWMVGPLHFGKVDHGIHVLLGIIFLAGGLFTKSND